MKYSDIIGLQNYFHPVFNLQKEGANSFWKQFITTTQFDNILEKTLDAVSSNIPSNRLSIWIQGTYGTGKSHAGAVIKHLLCDDVSEINDFVNSRIENQNLKNRLNSFRKEKQFFSVVLSGVEGAYNPRTFTLSIERSVKEKLKKEKHTIVVNSDFEQAIKELEENPLLKDFDDIIVKEPELRAIAKNKENIIRKLKNNDIDTIIALEEVLSKYSIQLSSGNITQWLSEVEAELKSKNIADGLLIIWDEFTSVVKTINNGIYDLIQKIASLTENQNVYLFLISHRHVDQLSEFTREEVSKMKDRFHILSYDMETITTYHIMGASIKRLNDLEYDNARKLQLDRNDNFDNLILYLTENETQQSKQDILDLYPFHPYTAFLCSIISGQIGSANRSVMKFMYDNVNGFLAFLNNPQNWDEKTLLTPDVLWDYFLDEFNERGGEKYSMIVQTYFTHKNTIQEKGIEFEKVFKGILLLNALKNTFDKDQILPSQSNIIKLFEGITFSTPVESILDYLHQNQIIERDPSPLKLFLIAVSSLPIQDVNNEIQRLKGNYTDAIQILEYDPEYKSEIKKIFDNELIREPELLYLSCSNDEALIKSRIKNGFKKTYTLPLVLFFASNNQELQRIKEIIQSMIRTDFPDKIFIIFDEYFDYDGNQRMQFVKYEANRLIATRHSSNDTAQSNSKNAKLIINNWVNRLKQGNYKLYFNEETFTGNVTQLPVYLNSNISYKIYSSGYEILPSFRINKETFFGTFRNKCTIPPDAMLMKNSREEVENKLTSYTAPAKSFFKNNDDYIIFENLEMKPTAPDNHPLVLAQKEVDRLLQKAKSTYSGTFNLGKVLYELTLAPFGYYSNIPSVALLSFAMRKYVNELYNSSGIDTPITADQMKEKIADIFTYWKDGKNENKLSVRFGSKEEKDLKEQLVKIFELEAITPKTGQDAIELSSIKNVRWVIDSLYLTKKIGKPLWVLKYNPHVSENVKNLIEKLNALIQNDSESNKIEDLKAILKLLKENLIDFQKLIIQQANFDSGFKTFVREVEPRFEDLWWEDLSTYFSQFLPPEIGKSWKEDDIEKAVLRFYNNKIAPPPIINPNPTSTGTTPAGSTNFPVETEKISKVRNKINNSSNSAPTLKYILLQILEIFPETADVIDENLE